jgi:tight adherence protein B
VIAETFWGTSTGLLLVLGACFLAVALVAWMMIGSRQRGRRVRSLASRLGRRSTKAEDEAPLEAQWMPSGLVEAGHRFAMATGFNAGLDYRLERAGVKMLAGEFVALTAVLAIAGGVFSALLLPNPVFILVIAGAAALGPFVWIARSISKRQGKLVDQLADTLSILASSLRAGYSFLQAIDTVAKEIGEPSASEFQRVVAEIRLGRPIDDALIAMAERVGSADLKWAVIAVNIQRTVGGNLAEVLDTVANTVRERAYIRRQVKTLSAEGRISVAILASLPFLVLLYLSIVNPTYLTPLFTTVPGKVMLVAGATMMGFGIWVMTRIVKIDV